MCRTYHVMNMCYFFAPCQLFEKKKESKMVIVVYLQEYIHRVGRTARGEGGVGHALLILRPEELGFLRYLKQAKVPLNEFEFSWSKIANIQPQVRNLNHIMSYFILNAMILVWIFLCNIAS